MRIEVEDIINRKRAHGCAHLPPGITLGKVFDHDKGLQEIRKSIIQVSINGVKIDNWAEVSPKQNDLVKISQAPGEIISGFIAGGAILAGGVSTATGGFVSASFAAGVALSSSLGTILGIVSVASFFVQLFNRPQAPKTRSGPRESPTYSFEGLQDTFVPGNPVPVIYGRHRAGGQVLMFYLEVASGSGGRRVIMNEQLAICHGEVASIGAVEINGIPAVDVSSTVTIQVRLGGSSQSTMDGFDRIRNSFSDGREISSEGIIYKMVGNAIESFDLIISAPALFSPNKEGNLEKQTVGYSLERRTSGSSAWTTVEADRRVIAKTTQKIHFQHSFTLPSRGAYDLQLKHVFHNHRKNKFAAQDIFLHAVTEYQDITGPNSGIAQIGIRAAATSQLQGGRPNITGVVYGKLVRVYTDLSTFTTRQTGNPAWCVRDYMTNSVYGMRIPPADINIQSFIDFATLADSSCDVCL